MTSYRVDYEDATGQVVVKYFDEDRSAAVRHARRISLKDNTMSFVIRAEGDYGEGFEDTGQIVFYAGRISDQVGVTQ